ncbi:MAG: HD domain-containing protein [Parcubacteria group bacterium]|jgi:uncharacterized protein
MLDQKEIIQKTVAYVQSALLQADGAHDWWHVYRVWQLAKHIAKEEGADTFVIELSALLHDVADAKLYGGDEEIGVRRIREFLSSVDISTDVIERVINIIIHLSFRETFHEKEYKSVELFVVQDADRLDALGAIGIARAFSYGERKGCKIHDPQIKPNLQMTKEQYVKRESTTINHFYEKLLLLKDQMNTKTGKVIAQERHAFMEQYLAEFYKEWEGKK